MINTNGIKRTIFFVSFILGVSFAVNAQDTTKLQRAGKAVDKAATKTANKTASTASKAKSAVVDKVYKDKTGPDGQTIYIDGSSKYYYVDAKGKKMYVKEAALKNK